MFFVPHGQAVAWGAGLEASPILGTDASPLEPTVLLIPVRRWSDGCHTDFELEDAMIREKPKGGRS